MTEAWANGTDTGRTAEDIEQLYTWWCINPVNHGLVAGSSPATKRAAIQDAIDEAAAGTLGTLGGIVVMPPGVWTIDSQLKVKNKVRLMGVNKRGTSILADPSFPINTPLIRLGDGTSIVFDARVERMTVDCNDITGSTSIWTTEANEGSGAEHVLASRFKAYGIDFDSGSSIVSANDIEAYSSSSSIAGVRFNTVAGSSTLNKLTAVGGGSGGDGALIVASNVTLSQIHVESYTDGVDCGANSTGTIIGAFGHATCPNLIHFEGSTKDWFALNIVTGGSTNAIVDDFTGMTIAENYVHAYGQRDLILGQARVIAGGGDPNGVFTAAKGSLFLRWDGGAGTCSYVKESGSGNTGWVAK